jgi:chaperone BCS1
MATPLVLAQQVFSALTNNLATNSTSEAAQATPVPFPTDLSSLVTFLCSLSALRDWLKLLVFGFVLESLRRLAFHFYYKLYDSLFITATFEEEDASYGLFHSSCV